MRFDPRLLVFVVVALAPAVAAQAPTNSEAPKYLLPPQPILDAFDAKPIPEAMLSPTRSLLALTERKANPTIAELARPMLRLAGARIDPRTNGPHRTTGRDPVTRQAIGIYAITLKRIADGSDLVLTVPSRASIANLHFSPDGARLSFTNTTDSAIQLWVADTAMGRARLVTGADRLNAASGDPCEWLHDSVTLVCAIVPPGRGPVPAPPPVPAGPNVLENNGQVSPSRTYEDLLHAAHDDALFDYYFTSQIAAYDSASGRRTLVGVPALYENVRPSPSGEYLLVIRTKRPFSHIEPRNAFPHDIEILDRRGRVTRRIAEAPSREGLPPSRVATGPRAVGWRPDQPATIVWVEALDDGDSRKPAPFRDKVVELAAPFAGAPTELARTEYRFANLNFTEEGLGLLSESDRTTRRTRSWILEADAPSRMLWDRNEEARYDDPGAPLTRGDQGAQAIADGRGAPVFGDRRGAGPSGPIIQIGDSIYLSGAGASPDGDRPFLDRLNVKTLSTSRLFRADPRTYETIVGLLNDTATSVLTRLETPADPPNYHVRDLARPSKRQLTAFVDPQPQLRGATRELITYQRKDGVKLSGELYLPPGYKKDSRLPLILWAYPREFTRADSAGEVSGSPHRFTIVTGASHLFLVLDGYAVLDNATMPIIGPGETANDTYIEQLVANAEAAIDKVVEMGVADRDRVGVGGHSYGAFMTANLLAHSRRFKAGFAESGAYNRTLTPFGFQNERRTFWEVPDLYGKLSPFRYADRIKDPILLTHGEADDNSGTFPIQSERFYMALKGLGATVRYETLPHEAHGYAARETLLHVIAEKVSWFGKYVKSAGVRSTTDRTP